MNPIEVLLQQLRTQLARQPRHANGEPAFTQRFITRVLEASEAGATHGQLEEIHPSIVNILQPHPPMEWVTLHYNHFKGSATTEMRQAIHRGITEERYTLQDFADHYGLYLGDARLMITEPAKHTSISDVAIAGAYANKANLARQAGQSFELNFAQFSEVMSATHCYYTDALLTPDIASFERIDPRAPYTADNTVLVTQESNWLKSRLDSFIHATTLTDKQKVEMLQLAIQGINRNPRDEEEFRQTQELADFLRRLVFSVPRGQARHELLLGIRSWVEDGDHKPVSGWDKQRFLAGYDRINAPLAKLIVGRIIHDIRCS